MRDLPLGIRRDVLLRLPAESLFRLRSISKGWRTMIDDPSFVKAHSQKQQASSYTTLLIRNSAGPPFSPLYLVDLQALDCTINAPQAIPATSLKLTRATLSSLPPLPTASCNGLLLISPMNSDRWRRGCLIDLDDGIWEIWNLLTHERLKLPRPNIKEQVWGYGFGYDSISDDYKVVLIEYKKRQTQVYSLRSNLWRVIEDCPLDLETREGVFLNGALHFVSSSLMIIEFDVETERYRTPKLNLPTLVANIRPSYIQLAALGGCLFLSFSIENYYISVKNYEGWVMNCYGEEGSWVKLFCLKDYHLHGLFDLRPVAYVKDTKCVLLQYDKGFLWVDVDGNSMKRVGVHGFCRDLFAQVFVGSLFRLRESCGSVLGDKKRRTRKRIADTRLTFCVKDYVTKDAYGYSYEYADHDACYRHSSDSNC